jgi:hypothetical protein
VPCSSSCNTPILGVKKPSKHWTLVQNLRMVNDAGIPIHPAVPNPYTLLLQILPDTGWFTVLKDAFFYIPVIQIPNTCLPLRTLRLSWDN